MNTTTEPSDADTTSCDDLRVPLVRYMDSQVGRILEQQQPDGSFGELRMLNDQYAFAPLALLRRTPASGYHGSVDLLEAIRRGMDALLGGLDEQGRVEFFGHDGISHGWHYYAWVTFYWQESLEWLREAVEEDWWQHHAEALGRTLAGHYERYEAGWNRRGRRFERGADVPNLWVWQAVLLYRAGVLREEPTWRSLGEEMVHSAIGAQQPAGWWSESGPVGVYNLVTAQAVSVYHEFSGDEAALKAVERSLAYHAALIYSDGTFVETIDGRMPYHENAPMMLPPTFSRFPEGRAFLRRQIGCMPAEPPNLQGVSMMSSTLAHMTDRPTKPSTAAAQLDQPCQVIEGIQAAVSRPHAFCLTACGYETKPSVSNWRLDRQSLISVWHAQTGLIVGGGNGKYQPELSCFNVNDRQGQIHYLHHQPTLHADPRTIKLAMSYGPTPVSIEMQATASDRVVLTFARHDAAASNEPASHLPHGSPPPYVQARLILHLAMGRTLRGQHVQQELDPRSLFWTAEDHGGELSTPGWILRLPGDPRVCVQWPVRRFNPYRPDRKGSMEHAALTVTMPLTADEPVAKCELQID